MTLNASGCWGDQPVASEDPATGRTPATGQARGTELLRKRITEWRTTESNRQRRSTLIFAWCGESVIRHLRECSTFESFSR